MPELRDDFIHALIQQVLPGAAPSAVEDLARRFVHDQPADIATYITTLRAQLPHAFPPATPVDAAPTPDSPAYNQYALDHLSELAGAAPPAGAASTSTPPPPTSIARGDEKEFLTHLEGVANGTIGVV